MDRFSSKEDIKPTFKSKALGVIYSPDSMDEQVRQITRIQIEACSEGNERILAEIEEAMKGVVFIDREFIEKLIKQLRLEIPIYGD